MKLLKKLLLAVLVLVLLVLVTALFVRKDYAAERSILIQRPIAEVFSFVSQLRNQNSYSKWGTMDPQMKQSYRGTDGVVGFVSAWESEKDDVGKGEQEITGIRAGERIDYELRFIEPFAGRADAYMTTEEAGNGQTLVRWGFRSRMHYPMNIMLLFMDMEGMIGDDFQTGLERLKGRLEERR